MVIAKIALQISRCRSLCRCNPQGSARSQDEQPGWTAGCGNVHEHIVVPSRLSASSTPAAFHYIRTYSTRIMKERMGSIMRERKKREGLCHSTPLCISVYLSPSPGTLLTRAIRKRAWLFKKAQEEARFTTDSLQKPIGLFLSRHTQQMTDQATAGFRRNRARAPARLIWCDSSPPGAVYKVATVAPDGLGQVHYSVSTTKTGLDCHWWCLPLACEKVPWPLQESRD
ncbi:hypothetical protein F5X96DRAFT_652322 [Biscogniauxia mediterranea]|nr:hypothetical protein F5X96DRAFT_652322 [Biscogniauxia mediterranea]